MVVIMMSIMIEMIRILKFLLRMGELSVLRLLLVILFCVVLFLFIL